MEQEKAHKERIDRIIEQYGEGYDAGMPDRQTWLALTEREKDEPLTLVNFFRFREIADYPEATDEAETDISGKEAFDRYAAKSGACLMNAGGSFLYAGAFAQGFVGDKEKWDLVVLGRYPSLDSLLALFEQNEYRSAYIHRVAGCADQRVSVCL